MVRRGYKDNVVLLSVIIMILATLKLSHGADAISHSVNEAEINNQNSLRKIDDSISGNLLQIRRLLKSLFLDWNSGESEIEGNFYLLTEADQRKF